jgi:hypothetical protein
MPKVHRDRKGAARRQQNIFKARAPSWAPCDSEDCCCRATCWAGALTQQSKEHGDDGHGEELHAGAHKHRQPGGERGRPEHVAVDLQARQPGADIEQQAQRPGTPIGESEDGKCTAYTTRLDRPAS